MDQKIDLIKQQLALQKEAHSVIEKLDLINFLSQFGKTQIVGSVVLGLMTWPDIDIEVTIKPDEKYLWATTQYLFKKFNVIDVTIADYTKGTNPKLPSGFYIGVKYKEENSVNKWKIDIWFKESLNALEDLEQIKSKLTDEKRMTILELKNQLSSHPEYRKTIFSLDIYKAVLDNNINNLEEFKAYLKESSREL